jgi:hypothetical protein
MSEQIGPQNENNGFSGSEMSGWAELAEQMEDNRLAVDELIDLVTPAEGEHDEAELTRYSRSRELADNLVETKQEGQLGEAAYELFTDSLNKSEESPTMIAHGRLSNLVTLLGLRGESHARYAAGYEKARQDRLEQAKAGKSLS